MALVGAGLFCIVFGLVKADGWGWGAAKTVGFLAAGVVLVFAFVLGELRSPVPLVPMRLLEERRMSFGCLVVMVIFFALFGVLFFITLYLVNVHGYDPVQAGLRVLPLSGTFILACPLGGLLNDKLGHASPSPAACCLCP